MCDCKVNSRSYLRLFKVKHVVNRGVFKITRLVKSGDFKTKRVVISASFRDKRYVKMVILR